MSYIDEVKEKVKEGKLEILESYRVFMDEHIIPEFVSQTGTNCAIVDKALIIDESINVDNFIKWLEDESFTVTTSKKDTFITISYQD